jgi:fibronectin-binding autotransporter adhesin
MFFGKSFRSHGVSLGSGAWVAFIAMVMVFAWSPSTSAQTLLYWDANGATAGTGGTGNWLAGGVTPNVWRNGSSTGTLQTWAASSRPVFGGTAGTVTISGTGGVGRITTGVVVAVGGYTIAEANGTRYLQITGADAINVTATTGATTISSPWALDAASTIRNNSSGLLTVSGPLVFGFGDVSSAASALTIGSSSGGNGDVLISSSLRAITTSGNTTGVSSVTKTGSGTLTLSGDNTYTSGTQINEGLLALGSAGALGTTGAISFGGGTLQFSASNTTDYSARLSTAAGQQYRFDTNGQNVALASALTSNGGSLTKFGVGQLTLSGTNTFSGLTTVNAGRLAVDGVLGAGGVSVLSTAELGGAGLVSGALIIAADGTLSPGGSINPATRIGSLSSGTATFAAGATFRYEVDSTDPGSLGTAADLIVVNGDLNLGAGNGSALEFIDLNPSPNPFVNSDTVFALANYTGSWNGNKFNVNGTALENGSTFFVGGQEWRIRYDYVYNPAAPTTTRPLNFTSDYVPVAGTQTFVAVIAVPEPAAIGLSVVGVGLAAVGVRSRALRRK